MITKLNSLLRLHALPIAVALIASAATAMHMLPLALQIAPIVDPIKGWMTVDIAWPGNGNDSHYSGSTGTINLSLPLQKTDGSYEVKDIEITVATGPEHTMIELGNQLRSKLAALNSQGFSVVVKQTGNSLIIYNVDYAQATDKSPNAKTTFPDPTDTSNSCRATSITYKSQV